jgi:S-adenosylmethionine:tRNA ribosyltransferase-isomerase
MTPSAAYAVPDLTAFELPSHLKAHEPPEERGQARDEVRMLVSRGDGLEHARFRDLPDFLDAGDVLVINTSRTLPAALAVLDDRDLSLHLSTHLPEGGVDRWVVELREADGPFLGARAGEVFELAGGAQAELLAPYLSSTRLWAARLRLPEPLLNYLSGNGRPITYGYVTGERPISAYQTVYGQEPGSAEMPSAGRPFTADLITELVARGVMVAPVVLHTGVSSLERDERPYPEHYRVPAATARLVNAARCGGGHVVAVGTTVVRALETVARPDGSVDAGEGWTSLVVTPERGVRTVDRLLTGWHEPDSSHLSMLEALCEPEILARSYRAALQNGYLWHEFGDIHLIM